MASPRASVILAGQGAPRLTATEKVTLGLVNGVSFYSALGWIGVAGYSHVTDGTPNYGTDSGAYGQRLGAAALRGYSEEFIGTAVLAPLLHQDPRYYKIGPRRNVVVRVAYAATRPLVARSDRGRLTPNFALVGGNLAGSSLTNLYYPSVNRGFGQTMTTFAGSMGGAALGYLFDEFLGNEALSKTLAAIHLKHP